MPGKKKASSAAWERTDLNGNVAVVAGASRGAGRGIALALGDCGATVYITGRTTRSGPRPSDGALGTVEDTAEGVMRRGGRGIPVRVDHTVNGEVAALFERVEREQGRLDVLVNAVWGGGEKFAEKDWKSRPFWELPDAGWQANMMAGPYAILLASWHAARLMVPRRKGLIVHVTEPIFEKYDRGGPLFWMFWMLGHRGINRISEAMSADLKKRKIATIALAPGWMRTERVMKHTSAKEKKSPNFAKSESTEYVGRAVAHLAADAKVLKRTGKLLYVGDLAEEYGFPDADGRRVANFYRELKMI
jgi:NAD(P)-dependent dehydrogenase (short-subunit alcohol dehydrogenase family)